VSGSRSGILLDQGIAGTKGYPSWIAERKTAILTATAVPAPGWQVLSAVVPEAAGWFLLFSTYR